jgi:hypothetical protein
MLTSGSVTPYILTSEGQSPTTNKTYDKEVEKVLTLSKEKKSMLV